MDYNRIYIYQAYGHVAATYADSKVEAFQKLEALAEHWTEPEITDVSSLDEFLTEALEEGEANEREA